MIYLNHAATTYPKPQVVQEAVARSIQEPPQSQYRGVAGSVYGEDVGKLCRENLARLFHIREPKRIFFTSGSTQALNMAILGLPYPLKGGGALQGTEAAAGGSRQQGTEKRGGRRRIVFTAAEHNAVLRTIYDGLREKIADGSVMPVVVPCDRSGYVDMESMEQAITEDTALVIVNHSSNVTGAVQDIARIGSWARQKGAYFLVDASQSAGALPIDVEAAGIHMLAFTGHKGLYGIEGTGGLYVEPGIILRPLVYGGTGTDSATLVPGEPFYEVGTMNQPGIAALCAGTRFILEVGLEQVMAWEQALVKRLYEGLRAIKGVTVYGDRQPEGTAVSFNLEGLSPADVGYILAGSYKIQVRTGLHCAPLLHECLGTQGQGTVRASISYLSKEEDVEALLGAVRELMGETRQQENP